MDWKAATGYSDQLIHGEGGRAWLRAGRFRLSAKLGFSTADDVGPGRGAFPSSVGLKTKIAQIAGARPEADEVLGHMRPRQKGERAAA